MSGQRFITEAQFNARSYEGPRINLRDRHDCKQIYRYVVTVPAGKNVLQILENTVLTATTQPQFIALDSNVEGVSWWPIDSASPTVDPDTVEFGWQMDMGAQDYEHVHGQLSGDLLLSPPNHASVGSLAFNDGAFPTFLNVHEDRAYLSGAGVTTVRFHDQVTTSSSPRASNVVSGGCASDMYKESHHASVGGGRLVFYAWGLGYKNFGTAADGLAFQPIIYVEDNTQLATSGQIVLKWAFGSYPYSTSLTSPALLPATNGLGDTIWGVADRMTDTASNHVTSPSSADVGLNGDQHGGYKDFQLRNVTDITIPDGWSTHLMRKTSARLINSPAQAPGSLYTGASMVWNRVTWTMFSLFHDYAETMNARFANFYFGPQPGLRRVLRPYEYSTDQPYSVASKPAIGLQNKTANDAQVSVIYGTK